MMPPTTDEVITAICVMIRERAEKHRDPSDPYPTSGTYAAATFAEELADEIASGAWLDYLRTVDKRIQPPMSAERAAQYSLDRIAMEQGPAPDPRPDTKGRTMKALLVDRLGFERIETGLAGERIIVPRKFVDGQSEFHIYGPVHRNGEELMEFREVDDMTEELQKAHSTANYLRGEIRRLEGTIRHLEGENGALALQIHRTPRAK
jgi:hypothetical protein